MAVGVQALYAPLVVTCQVIDSDDVLFLSPDPFQMVSAHDQGWSLATFSVAAFCFAISLLRAT